MISRRVSLSLLCCAITGLSSRAWAQDWPARPVTLLVPYAAGGNTDSMARIVAERLTRAIGKPFIVENKAGAGGTVAAEYAARAKPDGYTLFFGTVTQVSTAPFTNKIRYDPLKDFVPIANVGGNPYVIAARKDAPFKTLAELIKYGKENPGKLVVGHAGVGGLTHLSAALLLNAAGIKALLVPYKGGAPALTDVLGGQIDFYSGNLSEVLPYAKTGNLRLIAVSSAKRVEQLPDVPTIAETFPGYVVETWNGILGPAGMPKAAVDLIGLEMSKLHAEPEFRARLQSIGVTAIPEVKEAFRKRIVDDMAKWKPVIINAGIVPE
jgi:tripartite-type tricarboxylate transporter receptor subunit TctC